MSGVRFPSLAPTFQRLNVQFQAIWTHLGVFWEDRARFVPVRRSFGGPLNSSFVSGSSPSVDLLTGHQTQSLRSSDDPGRGPGSGSSVAFEVEIALVSRALPAIC